MVQDKQNLACIVIPARFASSRLPGKIMMIFDGEPVLAKTYHAAKKATLAHEVYIFVDDEMVFNWVKENLTLNVFMTDITCINGSERIGKHQSYLPSCYNVIVSVQADEPFIDPRNIDKAIELHMANSVSSDTVFYTTLHQRITDETYLLSPSCVKVVVSQDNKVLLYSRSVIPGSKTGKPDMNNKFYAFTGIYVFNRDLLALYPLLENTPLQLAEDVEQLKILESGYDIKSYEAPFYNEISLNDKNDLEYLLGKYGN